MTRKRFDPATNNLVDAEPVDRAVVAERIFQELGHRVEIEWLPGVDAIPVVETSKLPEGVQESALKNAIQRSHPRADGASTVGVDPADVREGPQ